MKTPDTVIERGGGNVFEDLGFADAGERKLKAQLVMQINIILGKRGLTQINRRQLAHRNRQRLKTLEADDSVRAMRASPALGR